MESASETEIIRSVAKSWNNLDISFAKEHMADDVIYESQFVFSSIEGKEDVASYFAGKYKTIKSDVEKGEISITAEMGSIASNKPPLIVLTQIIDKKTVQLTILVRVENGKIKRIDACKFPSPKLAKLSGDIPK